MTPLVAGQILEDPLERPITPLKKRMTTLFTIESASERTRLDDVMTSITKTVGVIVEPGVVVSNFDDRLPRVQRVLDAQGWTEMLEHHRPTVEEIVQEFYTNLHQRHGDSFLTWVREKLLRLLPLSSVKSWEHHMNMTQSTPS